MFIFTGIAAQFQCKPELTPPPNDKLGFNTAVSFYHIINFLCKSCSDSDSTTNMKVPLYFYVSDLIFLA